MGAGYCKLYRSYRFHVKFDHLIKYGILAEAGHWLVLYVIHLCVIFWDDVIGIQFACDKLL